MHVFVVFDWLQETQPAALQGQSARTVQWVSAKELSESGLSSGVKKVWKMAIAHQAVMQQKKAVMQEKKTGPFRKAWKQQRLKL